MVVSMVTIVVTTAGVTPTANSHLYGIGLYRVNALVGLPSTPPQSKKLSLLRVVLRLQYLDSHGQFLANRPKVAANLLVFT